MRHISLWAIPLIAALVLLVATVTFPASANVFAGVVTQSVSDVESYAHQPDSSGASYYSGVIPLLEFTKSGYPEQISITNLRYQVKAEYINDPSRLPNYFIYAGDLTTSGSKVASVEYNFFKKGSDGEYCNYDVVIYFNWCASPVLQRRYAPTGGTWSGGQSPSDYFRWIILDDACYFPGDYDPYMSVRLVDGGGGICYADDISIYYTHTFTNGFTITSSDYGHIINISRDYPFAQTSSRLIISPPYGNCYATPYTSSASSHNVQIGSTVVLQPQLAKFANFTLLSGNSNPPDNLGDDFTLSLSPTTAAVGDPVTATLTPAADAPRYSEVAWTVSDPDGNADIELYTKPSPDYTSWTHYNKTSRTFEASTESAAHNLTFTPTGPGTWTISAVVRDQQPPSTGATLASVSASCQVERKAGNIDVVISTYDGAYSSAHYLTGVGLTVWDLSRNATVIYDSTGSYILGSSGTYNGLVTVSAPLGDEIRIRAEKSGYIASDFNTFVQPTALPLNQMPISITLMPAATPAPDQVYASFTVRSAMGSPIPSAAVVAGGHLASTDSNGYARVAIPYNETVAYTVSASGYGSISGYILPATSNTALTVTLYVASTTTPATTAPDGSSTPPARDPGDVIDSGVSIVLEFFEILVFMGCIATLAGFAALMGGRRR